MFSFSRNLKTKNPTATEDVEVEESNESDSIGDRPVSQLSKWGFHLPSSFREIPKTEIILANSKL